MAFTVSRISSKASRTCLDDFARLRIDVEASKRSRYRSLRFHDASEQLRSRLEENSTHPTMSRSSSCFASASALMLLFNLVQPVLALM